jgi:hypothetical protein
MSAIDYDNFLSFVTQMNNSLNCDEQISYYKDIYDGYTTYMVSKKYDNDYIKNVRMNSLINSYIDYKNSTFNKKLLIDYYKNNYCDTFNMILDPPKCIFTAAAREKRMEAEYKKREQETDDIKHHYDEINEKYKYYYEISQKKEEDMEEEFQEEYQEDSQDDYYSTADSDDYYYDYYSDYESDYMSDEY